MIDINTYIIEKLKIDKDITIDKFDSTSERKKKMNNFMVNIIDLKGYGTINKKIEVWIESLNKIESLVAFTTIQYIKDVKMPDKIVKMVNVIASKDFDNKIHDIREEEKFQIVFNNGDTIIYTSKNSFVFLQPNISNGGIIFKVV